MSAEEFVLIPKNVYVKSQPIAEQVLNNPQIQRKAQYLSTIQDYISTQPNEDQILQQPSVEIPAQTREVTMAENILGDLIALTASQQVKSKHILKKIFENSNVNIDMSGGLVVDGKAIGLNAATFLWDIQQPTKKLDKATHEIMLKKLLLPEHLLGNKDAKDIVKHGWVSWP